MEQPEKNQRGKDRTRKSETITLNEAGVPEALYIWVPWFVGRVTWQGATPEVGTLPPCFDPHSGPVLLHLTQLCPPGQCSRIGQRL